MRTQADVRRDLLAAIAPAKQDDVHLELVTEFTIGQFLDELDNTVYTLERPNDLIVVFDCTRHRVSV